MVYPGEFITLSTGRREELSSSYSCDVSAVKTKGVDTCAGIGFYDQDGTWILAHLNNEMWRDQDVLEANLLEAFGTIGKFNYSQGSAVLGQPTQDRENLEPASEYANEFRVDQRGKYGGLKIDHNGLEASQTEFFDKDDWTKDQHLEFRDTIRKVSAQDIYYKIT